MKHLIVGCLLLFVHHLVWGQSSGYIPSHCSGDVPAAMTEYGSEKAKQLKAMLNKSNISGLKRSQKRDFTVQAGFFLDDVMKSGNILYGTAMNSGIQKIADKLLADRKDLREALHFFILRSTIPNAFATPSGYVFVSTGLIARTKTEAELAFVLSHEIQHFAQHHSVLAYSKLKAGKSSFVSLEDKLRDYYRFSRNNESEADSLGYLLFTTAGYAKSYAVSVLEKLKVSNAPFCEIGLTYGDYEIANLSKDSAAAYRKWQETMKENDSRNEADLYSTHPALDTRIHALGRMKPASAGSELEKVLSEDEFNKMVQMARFESLFVYINNAQYGVAFASSFSLEKQNGKNDFLDQIKFYALYAMAKMELYGVPRSSTGFNKNYFSDWKQSVFISAGLTAGSKEFLYFLTANIAPFIKKEDEFYTEKLEDLGKTLMSLYSKLNIPIVKNLEENSSDASYLKDFNNEVKNPEFIAWLKNSEAGAMADLVNENKQSELYIIQNNRRITEIASSSLGKTKLEHIYMLSPQFGQEDVTKKKITNVLLSNEEIQNLIYADIDKIDLKKSDLKISQVEGGSRPGITTAEINQFVVMSNWMNETFTQRMLMNVTNWSAPQPVIPFNKQYIGAELGNNDYLGVFNLNYKVRHRKFNGNALVTSVIFFYLLPVYIPWQISNEKYQSYTLAFLNVKTGELEYLQQKSISAKLKPAVLNMHLYDMYYRFHATYKNASK